MSQFRLRTNPHNSPLQRPPIPQSLSSLISLPSSTKKGTISREIGFPMKTFESVKDIMSTEDILFSRRENSSPQKSSSRGGKNHLNIIPSRTSENMKFSKRSSISTPKYNNISTRAGTLTSIASSTKIKNLQHPQSIQNLSTKMSNKARFSPFEMSTTKSSTAKSLMEIENRKIILKLDSASIEGDIATEREEFLRKFANGSPKRSISPSVDRGGDSDTSSEPNLTERIRKVREDSLVYRSGEDEEDEVIPQLNKKETEGKSRREAETTCRLQHNERSCRCVRHTASVEHTLKQLKIESKPKPSSKITLLIKKRRTSTTKNNKGTKHIGFSHQSKTILQLENLSEPILTPKAREVDEKPKIYISLNEIAQETPIERSPQVASSYTELGIKGVFSRRLDGMKNPRIQTDVTEDAPTTISVVTPKHKTETEGRKEDEDSAYKMSLLKRMKSEPQHRNIHTLEITEEMDEISIRKTTQEDKNNFSTTSIIKSRLNLTEESDLDVTTTVKNNNKGAAAKSSLNFKGLVELRKKEDLQEWVKLRRKTNQLDDDKEAWNGNIKVIEEIRRRNIWEETPKAKENEETGFEIFKQGPGNFFEWNTENKFVQKHNILGNLQENIMATRQKNRAAAELNDTNETIQIDHNSSKEISRQLRVPQRNTEKDPSPMMVRYYDEMNPLTIQPKYMESTGSMCVTELWGNKTKTSYYKQMRKPLQNSTLLSLTPGAGVYRPEKGLDSHTLKNKRILNGAIVQTENELITSIESPHCFETKKSYPTSKKARHTRAFVLQPSEKAKNNHPFRNISSKLGL